MESERLEEGKELIVEMLKTEAAIQSWGLPKNYDGTDAIQWGDRDGKIVLTFAAGLQQWPLISFFEDELEAVAEPGVYLRSLLEQRIRNCLKALPRPK